MTTSLNTPVRTTLRILHSRSEKDSRRASASATWARGVSASMVNGEYGGGSGGILAYAHGTASMVVVVAVPSCLFMVLRVSAIKGGGGGGGGA